MPAPSKQQMATEKQKGKPSRENSLGCTLKTKSKSKQVHQISVLMDHLRQVKVLEVKPVDDSEGKYVRKLSKKAEKTQFLHGCAMNIEYDADRIVVVIRQKVIMECKPEYSKLADILDKREKKEKGNEEKQP